MSFCLRIKNGGLFLQANPSKDSNFLFTMIFDSIPSSQVRADSGPKTSKSVNSPPTNSGLLPPSLPSVGASVPSVGYNGSSVSSGGYETRIDFLTMTLTSYMTPGDKVSLVSRINEILPNVSLSPSNRGMGRGFSHYQECYADCSGDLSSGVQVGFADFAGSYSRYVPLSRLIPFRGVSSSPDISLLYSGYFEDNSVAVRWSGPPVTASGSDKPFSFPPDSLIKCLSSQSSSSGSFSYCAVFPESWVASCEDAGVIANISKFLRLDVCLDSGSCFDFDYSAASDILMFCVFPQFLKCISQDFGNSQGSSGLVPVSCRVELPGGYFRSLPLREQMLIVARLDELGFNATRIDARISDYCKCFYPLEVQGYVESSQVTSFRSNSCYYGTSMDKQSRSMQVSSGTCYLGSKLSSRIVRIYDEKPKHGVDAIAWESVFKNEKAVDFVSKLISYLCDDFGYEKARLFLVNSVISGYDITKKPLNIDINSDNIDAISDSTVKSLNNKKRHRKKPPLDLLPKWSGFKASVIAFFSSPFCSDFVPFPVKGSRGGRASRVRLIPTAPREYKISSCDISYDGKVYSGQVASVPVDSRSEGLRRRDVYTPDSLRSIDSKNRFILNQVSGSLYFLKEFYSPSEFSYFMHTVMEEGKRKYEASCARNRSKSDTVDVLKGIKRHFITLNMLEDYYDDCLRIPLKGILLHLKDECDTISADESRIPKQFSFSSLKIVEPSSQKPFLPSVCEGPGSLTNEQIDSLIASSSSRLYDMCDNSTEYLDLKAFLEYRLKGCPMRSTAIVSDDGERRYFATSDERQSTNHYLDSFSRVSDELE